MKNICIHGHFYQPPRENPWLETVEPQDSAAPYHDWNERVTAECYAPNTAARILDASERIIDIRNNYSRISFDFGPTLLSWLEQRSPEVYRAILAADEESQERFSGHGCALAQVYNHAIMPLASRVTKELQVVWGIRDFEHRFRRKPEGMWLAETAVDVETLECLAAHGIQFTILAPSQAARTRRAGEEAWQEVTGGRVDGSLSYRQQLPSGRSIALFFYDGPVSRAVAFEGLLHRGEEFARRLASILREDEPGRLAHVATDGESYGHHHPHGDMALAYALHAIETDQRLTLTNYGEFLEKFPPAHEVEILERTSWSCAHGVERWRSDCGCRTGGQAGWTQAWRRPLREALDWLQGRIAGERAGALEATFPDPGAAHRDYIELVLDRDPERVSAFLARHGRRRFTTEEQAAALKLLELERQLQLMYTSCGWFFNDLSGIETVQILRYAGRAVQLAQDLFSVLVEDEFLERLSLAKSNRPEMGTGRDIYERQVKPSRVTFESLAAHFCISSLFESYPETAELYCYEVRREELESFRSGRTKLAFGRVRLTSRVTRASESLGFVALHFGDHNVIAGVERTPDVEELRRRQEEILASFRRADMAEALRSIDERFGPRTYNLRSLFGDEQRAIVAKLLQATLEEAEAAHRQIFEHHGATMRFLADLGVPPPRALAATAEVVLNGELRRVLSADGFDDEEVGRLFREAATEGVALDEPALSFVAGATLLRVTESFVRDPDALDGLRRLRRAVRLVQSLPLEVNLWKVQNLYFQCLRQILPGKLRASGAGEWLGEFAALGDELSIGIPAVP